MENLRVSKLDEQSGRSETPSFNPVLKAMGDEFGYRATHAILTHMSRVSLKPVRVILSDYDTFSRILKEVYTAGVAEKEVLGRLAKYGLEEKII